MGKHIDVVDGYHTCGACGRGTGHYNVELPEKRWKLEPTDSNPSACARALFDLLGANRGALERGARVTISERKIVIEYAVDDGDRP
jgi:hypothetical protein